MNAHLRNWYDPSLGTACVLVCGGPSLDTAMSEVTINQPGVLVAAVNNAALKVRPHLWFCADIPDRFHDRIWRDPGIRKFLPSDLGGRDLRQQSPNGEIERIRKAPVEMPGTVLYTASWTFDPSKWPGDVFIDRGPLEGESDAYGITGGRSVMIGALHVLYTLGIRTVYLVGADFRMFHVKPYAVHEPRHEGQLADNQKLYEIMNRRFKAAKADFDAIGLRVFNTTPGSALDAFDHVPLADAYAEMTYHYRETIRTHGWYYSIPEGKPV